MKNIVPGLALVLTVMSWSAIAEEQGSMHDKGSIEEQCKAMAAQHGMKGDQVDAWVKKCMEVSDKMKGNDDMGMDKDTNDMDEGNDMNDDSDMGDPEDGDSGMSNDSD